MAAVLCTLAWQVVLHRGNISAALQENSSVCVELKTADTQSVAPVQFTRFTTQRNEQVTALSMGQAKPTRTMQLFGTMQPRASTMNPIHLEFILRTEKKESDHKVH